MSIDFTCPHCGNRTSVADDYVGQSGPCARCGRTITIPAAQPSAVPRAQQPQLPPPTVESTTPVVLWLVLGAVGLCCLGSPLIVGVVMPAIEAARQQADRGRCVSNLRQIGVAMNAYMADYGTFPPAYVTDENGTAMHSWRVLLLPYLGAGDVYDAYRFDEPWFGPNNEKLADRMPDVYRCPDVQQHEPYLAGPSTSYLAVVGEGMVFDGPNASGLRDIIDGTSNTIMIVETSDTRVHWMAPDDLHEEYLSTRINDDENACISSYHQGGAHVLMADGHVEFLTDDHNAQHTAAMLTRAGDDDADFEGGE